jgi:uncharacterized membrane protein HdeD (DUF308 family)
MVKAPVSLCAAHTAVGIITLVLAGIVLVYPGISVFMIAVWLSISLFFAGIEGVIIGGAGGRFLSKGGRAMSVGLGAVAIALSIAVFVFPLAASLTLITLVSIGLLFIGASAIARGASEKRMSGWPRAMLIAVGAITVGLSVPVIIYPMLGLPILFAFVAAALIINGSSYVVADVTGAVFRRRLNLGLGRNSRDMSLESDAV